MEENNQNLNPAPPISPVDQTPPSTPPVSNSSNPRWQGRSLPKIAIGIILFLLIVGSVVGFYAYKQQGLKATPESTVKTANPTSLHNKINLNPNTGNLYSDIKVRLKEVLK